MKFLISFYCLFLISCFSPPKDFNFEWPTKNQSIVRKMTATHDGIDIGVSSNTPVYAAHKGIVIGTSYSSTYGRYIILENGDWATLYAHLTRSLVKRNDQVESQKIIGYSGATGEVTGPHLHFEILRKKQPVNPLILLEK